MKYHVTVDGEAVLVEIVERAGQTFVVDDGREIPVDLASLRDGGAWSLLVDTRSYPIVAAGPSGDLTLTVAGETWHCTVQDEREALLAAAVGTRTGRRSGGVLRSVMPGIVREVHATPGATVRRGDPLLILEAMKMQNEIRADADGVVAEVHVKAGTAVAKGDPLVTLGDRPS